MEKYVLVHNNQVVLGPFLWSHTRFENVIEEDYEIQVTLPSTMTPDVPYLVNQENNLWIYTARQGEDVPYNPRIEIHNGPFWVFNDKYAEFHYEPQLMDLSVAKSFMLQELAAERYRRETKGTKSTVQNVEVTVDTSREGRAIFIQKYSIMGDTETVDWKFPEGWLTLTKSELQQVINDGAAYVQSCFDWEKQTADQINACTIHEQLLDIVIVEPPPQPNFLPN